MPQKLCHFHWWGQRCHCPKVPLSKAINPNPHRGAHSSTAPHCGTPHCHGKSILFLPNLGPCWQLSWILPTFPSQPRRKDSQVELHPQCNTEVSLRKVGQNPAPFCCSWDQPLALDINQGSRDLFGTPKYKISMSQSKYTQGRDLLTAQCSWCFLKHSLVF